MKHLGIFLLTLALTACNDDKQEPSYYINLDENKLVTDYAGVTTRFEVTSNCDWSVGIVPQWCRAKKIISDHAEYLEIVVMPNETDHPREAIITLAYSYDRHKVTTTDLFISQSGKGKPEYDPLQWYTFATNNFSDIQFDLLSDKVTREYRISAQKLFVNPAFRTQVYPGQLINCHIDNPTLTVYDQYNYNPITISAYVNGKLYEKELLPTFNSMNEMVQRISSDLPTQSLQFSYIGPLQYFSYRHLHLLGVGNMGIHLDELMFGEPYTVTEMNKRTGFFYNYSWEMFTITMDYPEKLIQEEIDKELLQDISYVASVTFGRMSLLFIETDQDYAQAKAVVSKIMRKEQLSADDIKIKDDLIIHYIYFDKNDTPQIVTGDDQLVGKFVSDIGSLDIVPVGFTTNKLSNHQVGNLSIEFTLQ